MARNLDKERFWRDHIERWQESALGIRAYCRARDLSEPNFHAWRRELKRRANQSRPRKRGASGQKNGRAKMDRPAFVPIHLATAGRNGSGIEIVCDSPIRIALTQGFDHELLIEVLQLLETRSC